MLCYECETCHARKARAEEWILGRAAENIGAVSARREIAFEPEWDEERAKHPLAVHFCSIECKDRYLRSFFGDNARMTDRGVVPILVPRDASTRSARAHQRTRKHT